MRPSHLFSEENGDAAGTALGLHSFSLPPGANVRNDAPRWTVSTSLRYERPWRGYNLVAQAQNSYQSPSYDLSYHLNKLPGRDLTNLRVGLEADKWSVYTFANNVFNRHYALEDLNLLTFTGPDYNRVATNQPLTAGLELEVKF